MESTHPGGYSRRTNPCACPSRQVALCNKGSWSSSTTSNRGPSGSGAGDGGSKEKPWIGTLGSEDVDVSPKLHLVILYW